MNGLTRLLLPLLGLIGSCSLFATEFNQQITAQQERIVPLQILHPSYYRGVIRSDVPFKRITLTDTHGHVIHELLKDGKEAEVFWYAQTPNAYQFHLTPYSDTTAKITLKLHTLKLKKDQFVSPPQTMISPKLQQLANDLKNGIPQAENQFWDEIYQHGAPLVEAGKKGKTLITFLYHGNQSIKNVRVLGAPFDGHVHLSKLSGSNIWFKSYEVPVTTRLSYRIAPNVPQLAEDNWHEQRRAVLATSGPDPLNQEPLFGQNGGLFGSASTLTLAKAPSDHFTQHLGNPKGAVTDVHYQSKRLGNTRKISLYQPNKRYPLGSDSPLLIVFDGDDYLTRVPTPQILDNLIAEGKIPPMRAVFINPPLPSMRAEELTPNQRYADFLATEFKPWLCQQFSICPSAANTVLSGSSFGGLASMYIAFRHPQQFGKVLSQSGSFWWSPSNAKAPDEAPADWLAHQIKVAPKQPIKIYLNAGSFEVNPPSHSILETNLKLVKTLKSKGYSVDFEEVASGHDYFSWRVMLAHGLIALFTHNDK